MFFFTYEVIGHKFKPFSFMLSTDHVEAVHNAGRIELQYCWIREATTALVEEDRGGD